MPNSMKKTVTRTDNIDDISNIKSNNHPIDLVYVNNRIRNEICNLTIERLTDVNLSDEYHKCKSVRNKIKKFTDILDKYKIKSKTKDKIINDYLLELIPAGTKGVIRGNKFNSIVRDTIMNLNLDNKRFEICFEKQCELRRTSEIPDWYILDRSTEKVIIGMNQLDLWKGGQQINRGSKYLIDNPLNTEKSKLLCVVCNPIKFKSSKNKEFNLFKIGYQNNTLCYIKNIQSIVLTYFS